MNYYFIGLCNAVWLDYYRFCCKQFLQSICKTAHGAFVNCLQSVHCKTFPLAHKQGRQKWSSCPSFGQTNISQGKNKSPFLPKVLVWSLRLVRLIILSYNRLTRHIKRCKIISNPHIQFIVMLTRHSVVQKAELTEWQCGEAIGRPCISLNSVQG